MTEKIFTLNTDQIKAIYRAGIARGAEEEACFQSGDSPAGGELDELVNVIFDILNEDKTWVEKGQTDFTTIETWFR